MSALARGLVYELKREWDSHEVLCAACATLFRRRGWSVKAKRPQPAVEQPCMRFDQHPRRQANIEARFYDATKRSQESRAGGDPAVRSAQPSPAPAERPALRLQPVRSPARRPGGDAGVPRARRG